MPNETPIPERVATLEAQMEADKSVLKDHIRDCLEVRRRNESKLDDIAGDVKTLLAQSNKAEGRGAANALLLGGIPNALWSVIIAGTSAGLVILAMRLMKGS
jgi:hypothetical protein